MPFAKKVISGGSGISKDDIDKINKGIEDRFNALTSSQQQDAEVIDARDGETSLKARLDRDIEKAKEIYVPIEGSNISTDSSSGYLKDIEILGNTIQDASNLADIRSVGDTVEGQELYEIPVLSRGKNLFYGELESGGYDTTNGTPTDSGYYVRGKNFIPVNPLLGVCVNFKYNGTQRYSTHITEYDSEYNFIKDTYAINGTLTLGATTRFIRVTLYCGVIASPSDVTDVQLECGTVATPYEPYQEDKLTILSPVQLEKVGDVADRIIEKDGVWGVEKNVINARLQKGWATCGWASTPNTIPFRLNNVENNGLGVCNMFALNRNNATIDEEAFNVDSKWKEISVRVNRSRLTTQDVKGFEEWLLTSGLILLYPTTQPQFIPLPHDQQIKLRTFANKTNISFGCEIEGTIKAQVPKSLGATVNTHTEQISNLNKELDRVKKLEESTVSTVTTESDFTTVEATSNGYFEDVKLEGKTLVNLANGGFNKNTINSNGSGDGWLDLNINLEANKLYTIVLTISNKIVGTEPIKFKQRPINGGTSFQDNNLFNLPNGTHAKLFIPTESYNRLSLYYSSNVDNPSSCDISNAIILEGDHTQNPPSYFEGLKSVGQDVEEVSVESVNENLYTFSSLLYASLDSVRLGKHYTHTYNILNTPSNRVFGGIFKLPKSNHRKLYIKCGGYRFAHSFTDKDGILLRDDGWEHNDVPISPLIGEEYLVIYICREDGQVMSQKDLDFIAQNAVIRYADNFSDIKHTPHQSDKKLLLYYNEETQTWEKPILREWDSIEKHADGKYYYHKRSNEAKLTGNEPPTKWGQTECFMFRTWQGIFKDDMCVCDKLPFTNVSTMYGQGVMGVSCNSNGIILNVGKSTVEEMKEWLQSNNITVVCQLAQEEVYECTNIDLITYANETNYVINSGTIVPRTTLKVHNNISNVVRELQIKVSTLESYIQYTILNALKNALNE